MSQWDDFLAEAEHGVGAAAATALNGFVNEARNDCQSFLTAIEADLKTWTQQLATGQISGQDLSDFVQADAALATMAALTEAGIAAADLQRFRDTLVNVVINAALSSFKV
jgi:hypothetical protein